MAVTHGRLRISADPAWGWCAGLRHPPSAEYPAGFFSAAHLEQMRADPALTVEEMGEGTRTAQELLGGVSSEHLARAVEAFVVAGNEQHHFAERLSEIIDRAIHAGWSVEQFRAAIDEMAGSRAAPTGAPSPSDGAATAGDAEGVAGANARASGGEDQSADDPPAVTEAAPAAASVAEPIEGAASGAVSDAGQPDPGAQAPAVNPAGDGDAGLGQQPAAAEQEAAGAAGAPTLTRQRRRAAR